MATTAEEGPRTSEGRLFWLEMHDICPHFDAAGKFRIDAKGEAITPTSIGVLEADPRGLARLVARDWARGKFQAMVGTNCHVSEG